ncbi:MAG: hypothetical protein LKG79_07855 [Furfurilactobacillus sp.]|jgi:hypothetical protein|uniref:hypothetical protein n=1 Tax=Furfurilactobacillus TaxID=2767882 RepID=UPI001F16E164|nr:MULTISPECIES: hypothetical protein [Furfurilactobacillus]MCF6420023.1 hypothetical protein [Furfurilactobacillus milii]MCH4012193.1 hypothetical protein [Furfurilactobacillus sp.]MCH4038085.1 hypothetical protein [Furfurilactobacillus sp.]MCH4115278.1 hypothetical protein [Furfurilactobacillus sp.]MCI1340012.1 hypothetical protein [Furfurilactobacillus sp.]
MNKWLQLVISYTLGLIFFAFFTLVAHLKPAGGLFYTLTAFDYGNLVNWLLLYPFARASVSRWRQLRRQGKADDNRGFIRRAYDENGESFAQTEYNSAWASHGSPNGGSALLTFMLYGLVYIFAVVIDAWLLIRLVFVKHQKS